ncbi:ubiquinol-cytochrome c reductase iron-sulfur subunit [Deinococcus sp.]|uniref:QcrA and Rieske domain-containing protein n=1 Tax=Deinococcus sp. TaxID=47478 RepID=UPI003C7E5450
MNRRTLLERWWLIPVGLTASAFAGLGLYALRVSRKSVPGGPQFQAGAAQKVSAFSNLGDDWAEVNFVYAGRPCTLLRLPAATLGSLELEGRHYAAFSRVCTHLGCTVNLVRDTEVLAFSFNYRAPDPEGQHPYLGCPCHYSVFNPLASGEAVFGKAHLPLPRVRLERRGGDLWATGIEPAPANAG